MQNKIKEYLNYLQVEKNCSSKTLYNYKNDIEQFSNEMKIESTLDISKNKIRAFLSFLVNNNMEASTRNRKLTAIRSFCKYLCAEGYIQNNPALDIAYAKLEKRLPKVMTVEKTNQVIDSADINLRDLAVLETLYGTGCRVEELVNIKINNIDISNLTIRLFGKGSKERLVPISAGALAAILDYLQTRGFSSVYLFPSPRNYNKPISTKAMYNLVVKYGKMNNVDISPHKFRHSIATHLLSKGMDIRKIQELLGHSNINTTTIYTQVAIEQMAREFHSAHPRG